MWIRRALQMSSVAIIVILMIIGYILGITPAYISNAPAMTTAMASKLVCSSVFVTGMDEEQAKQDLGSYSPVFDWLDINVDRGAKSVSAQFFNWTQASSTFYPGVGCVRDLGDVSDLVLFSQRYQNQVDAVATEFGARVKGWPMGDRVDTYRPVLQEQVRRFLDEDNRKGLQTRALLMAVDGKIVGEAYAEGFDENSKLLGWSMAKSVIAILVGHMEMAGVWSLQQDQLVAEWREDQRSKIRLANLLQMTSGLEFPDRYVPGSETTKMLFSSYSAAHSAIRAAAHFPPGERFQYSSGSTNLLSYLLFHAAGGTFSAYKDALQRTLIEPLNLSHFVFEPDPSGVFVGSSYLYASARDWARIGQLMLNGGELNGHRVVSNEWVKQARQPNQSDNYGGYGYQFWLNRGGETPRWEDLPVDAYAAMGNRQQVVMIIPSMNTVIVRLGWTRWIYPTNERFSQLLEAVAANQTVDASDDDFMQQ